MNLEPRRSRRSNRSPGYSAFLSGLLTVVLIGALICTVTTAYVLVLWDATGT